MKRLMMSLGLAGLAAILGSLSGPAAQAGVVISERTVPLEVKISPETVKLSHADYSMPVVKVLVPGLADVTILDHRNSGEGAPCLATDGTRSPEDVIRGSSTTETLPFTIRLERSVYPDLDAKKCYVLLEEFVSGEIRGYQFTHHRDFQVADRHLDDCR